MTEEKDEDNDHKEKP